MTHCPALFPPAKLPQILVASALLLAATTSSADAGSRSASAIEEVVVTGDYRNSTLDTLAASVAVLDRDAVSRRNAQHLEEALAMAANVNLANGANRARFVQIRGIGERGQFREPLNPSVGILVDGIDVSSIGTAGTLFDLDQVEIFRGPQGTLYGAYALAGLINITTGAPTREPEFSVTAGLGNTNARQLGAVASGPLSDRVSGRLAIQQYSSDGSVENIFLGQDDTNNRDELTVRGKLRLELNPELTLDLTGLLLDLDNGYDSFSLDNNRKTRSDEPGQDTLATTALGARLQWLAPRGFDLDLNLGLASSDVDYGYDEDWTFDGFHPFGYTSTDRYRRQRDTFNVDARLLSDDSSALFNNRSSWVLGVYAFDREVDLRRDYTFAAGPFNSSLETTRVALYGQLDTSLSERLTLSTGARWERQDSRYRDSDGATYNPDENFWGGRVALSLTLDDGNLLYAALSRGFKAGGFNTDGTLPEGQRQFDAESLVNLELGLKGQWLDGRVQGRLALFAMERDDVQLDSSLALVRPDGSTEFIDFIGNASSGYNRGLELEANWLASSNLTLSAAVGLLASSFEDYRNADSNRQQALDGRDQPQAPNWQVHTAAEYRFQRGFFTRLELEGRDAYYFSTSHEARSNSYLLVNLMAGLERDRWAVTLWARNLGNREYAVRGFSFGNDPRDNYAERTWLQLAEPRRFGATVTVRM